MAYSNYGMDPNMAADMDRIFCDVLTVMMNNGSIDVNARNFCDTQYRQFRHAILGSIPQKAQAANRPIDLNLIQDAVHEFIQNVLTSFKSQSAYGGYPQGGYPAGGMYNGGLGAYTSYPAGGMYGVPPQMGTSYHNPAYGGGTGYSGYPSGGYGSYRRYPGANNIPCGYEPAGPTATQSTNADRYSTLTKSQPAQPTHNPVNSILNTQSATTQQKVEYTKPTECDSAAISNSTFTGSKKVLFLGNKQYIDVIIGSTVKPISNVKELLNRCSSFSDNKLKFIMASTKMPKVINAPVREITALVQKLGAVVAKELQDGSGAAQMKKAFFRFHTEFMKESGTAADALRNFIIEEFNDLVAGGYLFKDITGHLVIDCLDDIMELYNENTTNVDIKEWQKSASYFSVLSIAVYRSILGLFVNGDHYHICQTSNPQDRRIIGATFGDLGTDTMSVNEAFFTLFNAVSSKEISAEASKAAKELYGEIGNQTIVLVPRVIVYTNLAPAGFVRGDYASVNITRIWSQVSNILEDCLTAGFKALNTTASAITVNGVIDAANNLYPFSLGVTTDGNMFIGKSRSNSILM